MEIKRQPVPTLSVFHRKCELVSISCDSQNNFRGPLKTEDRVLTLSPKSHVPTQAYSRRQTYSGEMIPLRTGNRIYCS
jgi:hypothetical protein